MTAAVQEMPSRPPGQDESSHPAAVVNDNLKNGPNIVHDPLNEDRVLSVEEEINSVEQRMKEFELSARYLDAERERKKLGHLKSQIQTLKKQEMKRHQQEDYRQFRELADRQQDEFDVVWEKTFADHNVKTKQLHHVLKSKHESQLLELRAQLEHKISAPRYSVNLLTLRKKQCMLAKCQRYLEAEKVRKEADTVKDIELEEHRKRCQKQNQSHLDQLLEQHLLEMRALRQKMELERKNLMEIRNQEQEKLQFRLRKSAVELNKSHARQKRLTETVSLRSTPSPRAFSQTAISGRRSTRTAPQPRPFSLTYTPQSVPPTAAGIAGRKRNFSVRRVASGNTQPGSGTSRANPRVATAGPSATSQTKQSAPTTDKQTSDGESARRSSGETVSKNSKEGNEESDQSEYSTGFSGNDEENKS
eukprot:494291_1